MKQAIGSTNAEAQRAIDEQKAKINELIRALCERRNTHSLIGKVPHQLLSQIFLFCKDLADAELFRDPRTYTRSLPPAQVAVLAAVCSRWRGIVLDTPQLWTAITLDNPFLFGASLERSEQAPLRLLVTPRTIRYHDHRPEKGLPLTRKVALPLARAEELVVCGDLRHSRSFISDCVVPNTSIPVPLLRTLRLDLFNNSRSKSSPPAPLILPDFWPAVPRLSAMILRNIIPLNFPVLPALTNLEIDVSARNNAYSVPWLISLLRNAPNLEDIDVSVITSDIPWDDIDSPVSLPKLRRLKIAFGWLEDSSFFQYVDAPPTANVSVSFLNDHTDRYARNVQNMSMVHTTLPSFARLVYLPDSVFRMDIKDTRHMEDDDGFSYTLNAERTDGESPNLYLTVQHISYSRAEPTLLHHGLPFYIVYHLSVTNIRDIEQASTWSRLLPFFVRLKTVSVDYKEILSVALTRTCPSTKQLFNPDLEAISIVRDWKCPAQEDWTRLASALRKRSKAGKAVLSLVIEDCRVVSAEYLAELRKYTDVQWDGRKHLSMSEDMKMKLSRASGCNYRSDSDSDL